MFGIKHIEFWVRDLGRTLEFYRAFLPIIGWEEDGSNGFCCGTQKIYFKLAPPRAICKKCCFGPRHICFHSMRRDGVDQVASRVQSISPNAIFRGPQEIIGEEYSPDYYAVYFRDPDGFILEVAYSPNSPLDR